MNKQKRQFEGIWIPKEIWLSKDLTTQEKLFFVEIKSLDNEDGCFANNKYFSDFFGISKTRCSLVISSLTKKGYIRSTMIYKEGTKQILKRVLNISYTPPLTKVKYPIQQKLKDNSTISNTTNSTINNKGDFAEKSAPLPNGSEKKEPQLKAKTKPKRKKVAAKKEIAKTKSKELSLHSKAKARFEHWQQIHNKEAPPVYWDGKEVGQLTQMINRLQDAARKKGYSWKNDDDFINRFFDVFCKKFIESGQWYADCFVPSAIVSQWNRIMQTLHDNGKKTNRSQNTGVTDSFRAKIIETLSRT